FVTAAAALLVVAPAFMSDFRLSLLAKFLCFAIIAVGISLAWGRGGMLVLGQGIFFGLGGYSMGMFLKLDEAGAGKLPDFMTWSGVESLPLLWEPFRHAWFAVAAAILIPIALATVLGLLVFRRGVRTVYFALLSQALAAAFVILLVGQQGLTGGTNGLTNFQTFFGLDLADPASHRILYFMVVIALGLVYLLARQLVASRYGRLLVAVRDAETRVKFLGYDPTRIKVVAFAAAAGMAGLAGALFVPVVGIISPALLGVVPSLEMVVLVAVGGRATLAGAVLGALLVSYAKTGLSERWPASWTYLQGLLFVLVILYAPKGLAGLGPALRERLSALRLPGRRDPAPAAALVAPASEPPVAAAAPAERASPPAMKRHA
ncbi:MAG: urea transport system permease protein, partial [Solirubrobacteraceae bacterium]|nr:urea transport system permease protein [Solirubrobacteraceae bacterium]